MRAGGKKPNKKMAYGTSVVREGSGNVFADLKVPDSEEALAKAEIAARIASAIARRRLTQARAATLLGVDQGDVSDLVRGKLKGFSTDRLLRFLNALGQDVDIVIYVNDRIRRAGRIRVREESRQLKAAERFMRRYRNALRNLAK
jgi:predicted XRE-type DNA-binding protein